MVLRDLLPPITVVAGVSTVVRQGLDRVGEVTARDVRKVGLTSDKEAHCAERASGTRLMVGPGSGAGKHDAVGYQHTAHRLCPNRVTRRL